MKLTIEIVFADKRSPQREIEIAEAIRDMRDSFAQISGKVVAVVKSEPLAYAEEK